MEHLEYLKSPQFLYIHATIDVRKQTYYFSKILIIFRLYWNIVVAFWFEYRTINTLKVNSMASKSVRYVLAAPFNKSIKVTEHHSEKLTSDAGVLLLRSLYMLTGPPLAWQRS